MKKITKKDSKAFVDGVSKALLGFGATEKKISIPFKGIREFSLETSVGKLDVTLYDDNEHCFTAFSIFEDAKCAKVKFDCNPNSGKYNSYISAMPVEDAIEIAVNHFEVTL
jgi:hypothetical protein